MTDPDLIERAARAAHEVNRVYRMMVGEEAGPPWETAPQAMRESTMHGVSKLVANPFLTPSQMHESWCKTYFDAGWREGPVKSFADRTHPNLKPYAQLTPDQRAKDHIFRAVVLGVIGKPEASYTIAILEHMRESMDQIMSEAETDMKAINLTVDATPDDRAQIPVIEARGNMAGFISAELAAVITEISGLPARG